MTGARGGDDQDAELERLGRQFPQWRIWRGRATGEYWALPPPRPAGGHRRRVVRNLVQRPVPRGMLRYGEGVIRWNVQVTATR